MIDIRGLTKVFGRHAAVADVSLRVESGEVVALLGPNGSGKTTCLKATAGLVAPTSGGVWLGPAPGRPARGPEARRVLSYLPQRVAFPEALTGLEVVRFYGALRGVDPARGDAVLRFASLNGASRRAVGTYSGGMVQRLGLAVALLPNAPVLLLDEPTASLDPEGLVAFYEVVEQRKRQGQTVLFTSHHLGDAERLADRFALLVDGRLAACLTQRELGERLDAQGRMRLRLAAQGPRCLEALRQHGFEARLEGDDLSVRCASDRRPAALEALRAAGAEILTLTTEEGRLDALYRELLGGIV